MDPDVEIVLCAGGAEMDPLEIGGLVPPEEKLSYLPTSASPGEVRQMIIALSSKWLAERRIVRVAHFDSLTRLPNREQFRHRLSQALEAARHQNLPLGVLYLDLDQFKDVNDTLGHAAGDQLLCAVARRLRDNLRYERSGGLHNGASVSRPGDLARLGGDEFVALLPGLRTVSDAARVAERLITSVREPVQLAGTAIVVTPSVGIAIYPKDGANSETLLRNADAAMYCAKRRRPGTYSFFEPGMNEAAILPFPNRRALHEACR
jgi:diguanylate cyclase (GGDEF)-like protein